MKLILTQLALLLISTATYSQNVNYEDLYLKPDARLEKKKGGYDVYHIGKLKFFNGVGNDAKSFHIEEPNGKVLYVFEEKESKASRFKPRFFSAGDNNPILVLLNLETSYSWGQHILIIDGEEVSNIGFIAMGADNFNFSDIGLYARIQAVDDHYLLSFNQDEIFIDYLTDDSIPGAEIKYKLDKSGIYRLTN